MEFRLQAEYGAGGRFRLKAELQTCPRTDGLLQFYP